MKVGDRVYAYDDWLEGGGIGEIVCVGETLIHVHIESTNLTLPFAQCEVFPTRRITWSGEEVK